MKKYWRMIPVLTCLLILLAGCGSPEPEETAETEETPAPTEVTQTVTGLTFTADSLTLRFSLDEDKGWQWADDPSFPLDDQYIQAVLNDLAQMQGQTVPQESLADYGLSDAARCLEATASDGTATYCLGSALDDGSRYIYREAEPTVVYPAPGSLTAMLGRSIYDMARLPAFPALSADTIRTVEIARGDTVISLRVEDGSWFSGEQDVTDQAAALADVLSQLSFSRCMDYAPSDGATAVCGLSDPAAVLTVTYAGSMGLDSTLTLTIGGAYGEDRFALTGEDTTIYLLPGGQAAPILALAESGL